MAETMAKSAPSKISERDDTPQSPLLDYLGILPDQQALIRKSLRTSCLGKAGAKLAAILETDVPLEFDGLVQQIEESWDAVRKAEAGAEDFLQKVKDFDVARKQTEIVAQTLKRQALKLIDLMDRIDFAIPDDLDFASTKPAAPDVIEYLKSVVGEIAKLFEASEVLISLTRLEDDAYLDFTSIGVGDNTAMRLYARDFSKSGPGKGAPEIFLNPIGHVVKDVYHRGHRQTRGTLDGSCLEKSEVHAMVGAWLSVLQQIRTTSDAISSVQPNLNVLHNLEFSLNMVKKKLAEIEES